MPPKVSDREKWSTFRDTQLTNFKAAQLLNLKQIGRLIFKMVTNHLEQISLFYSCKRRKKIGINRLTCSCLEQVRLQDSPYFLC